MELVCRIHEAGSISHAARRLGISQPSLTAALHRVEKAAGGRLFERTKRGVEPTELGLFLLERARPLINEVRALTAAVRRRAVEGDRRQLRVALAPTPYLGQFLTTLESLHELTASVEYGFHEVLGKLATGRLDAAVLGYSPELPLDLSPGLRVRHLVDAEPCWVAMSSSHPLAQLAEVELAALAEQDWVAPPGGASDGTGAHLESACRQAGFSPRIRYRMDDTAAITQLLKQTRAVIIAQPTCHCPPGIVVRPLIGDPITFRTSFVWRAERLSDVDAVFDLLVRAYATVIANNEPYPRWWKENGWAHQDPAWSRDLTLVAAQ